MKRTAGFEKHLDEKMEELGYSQSQYELGYENRRPTMTMTRGMGREDLSDLADRLAPDFNAELKGNKLVFMPVKEEFRVGSSRGSVASDEGLTDREVGRLFEIIGEMEAVAKEALGLMRRTSDKQVEDKAFRLIDRGIGNLELAAERLDMQLGDVEPGGRVSSEGAGKLARELKAVGPETVLATNTSGWRWEYDSSIRTATVTVDERENLRMTIVEFTAKTGLGKGEWSTTLEDVSLGTLTRPRLGLVQGLLRKHAHERSSAGWGFKRAWTMPDGGSGSLGEIISKKAVEWGTRAAPVVQLPAVDSRQRKELLMKFVQSMTPEEVEKAFAAVLGKR